ncbi:helix-turn-helix domain-containing protein [bacterium]|nr:helix-turn-helix domain-containing protein [bacterium]
MGMPNKKEIKKVLDDLKNSEGSLVLQDDATPLEKLRFEICQKFIKYKLSNKLNQKELAEILEVDEAKVSKILRHRIDEFSTDRLISLYYKLDPELVLKVS